MEKTLPCLPPFANYLQLFASCDLLLVIYDRESPESGMIVGYEDAVFTRGTSGFA